MNFGSGIAKIVRKRERGEREIMWQKGEREKVILAMVMLIYRPNFINWPDRNKKRENLNCQNSTFFFSLPSPPILAL